MHERTQCHARMSIVEEEDEVSLLKLCLARRNTTVGQYIVYKRSCPSDSGALLQLRIIPVLGLGITERLLSPHAHRFSEEPLSHPLHLPLHHLHQLRHHMLYSTTLYLIIIVVNIIYENISQLFRHIATKACCYD